MRVRVPDLVTGATFEAAVPRNLTPAVCVAARGANNFGVRYTVTVPEGATSHVYIDTHQVNQITRIQFI